MSARATRLRSRVVGIQLGFSVSAAVVVGVLAPHLLLLSGSIAVQGAATLAVGVALGGVVGSAYTAGRLMRYRYLIRSLAVGSSGIEAHELHALSNEPKRALAAWLLPTGVGATLATTVLRPSIVDLTTGITLCLLGLVITAVASLPLFVLLRAALLDSLELAPHEVMREVVEEAEDAGRIEQRLSRRMVAAVTMPTIFLAIGASLIVNAHVRRADERDREETARVFARAALEAGPGVVRLAGIDAALERGRARGFTARLSEKPADYAVTRGDDGVVNLHAPLETGSAEVRFDGSTVGFLSWQFLLVALMATGLASFLGTTLGATLARDLHGATRNVRELGTEAVLSGSTRILRSARFRVVAELGGAIDRLAQRFRVFATAQERAIEARKAAARMRGLFFASVSHDLKAPLNAILGFTELARNMENVTPGQAESLDLIERRGRELLALIETILDAARVEAGQLTLVLDPTGIATLLGEAAQKGRELASDRDLPVVFEISGPDRQIPVDRVRMPRALATFIAHALRTTEASAVRLLASTENPKSVRIEIEIANPHFPVSRLEAMLDPNRDPGAHEHRGLALGLRLARAVTELHGGKVEVVRRKNQGGSLRVTLPA
ncbi:MAG TPA: HAMP domain-containing sensor histidine kinase [Polyangiaceae bacterium]|nr:HAMP domain-containing sensor histidine kinase [Polyangiaceae bacterium]